MTVKEALYSRFSCRVFSDKPVPHEVLKEVFSAAFRSPSCENSQPWELYVAGQEALKELREECEKLRKAKVSPDLSNRFNGKWIDEMMARVNEYFDGIVAHEPKGNFDYTLQKRNLFYAPVMAFICADEELPDWSLFDIGIFSQSLMLAAAEQGLATMPSAVSVSYPDAIRRVLDIPENKRVIIGIGIGYADENAAVNSFKTSRKGTDEIHYKP